MSDFMGRIEINRERRAEAQKASEEVVMYPVLLEGTPEEIYRRGVRDGHLRATVYRIREDEASIGE